MIVLVMSLLMIAAAGAAHAVQFGMDYWVHLGSDRPGCSSAHWHHPLMMNGVQSLVVPDGCYVAADPGVVAQEAKYLDALGVDFIVVDQTNLSKHTPPERNIEVTGLRALVEGFRAYRAGTGGAHIKVVPFLSITSWAMYDHPACVGQFGIGPYTEVLTLTEPMRQTLQVIYDLVRQFPDSFLTLNGKPLLTFYVSTGSEVKHSEKDGYGREVCANTPAFQGPRHLLPTEDQLRSPRYASVLSVTTPQGTASVLDLFTVRFRLVSDPLLHGTTDYTEVPGLWPFAQSSYARFAEAGFVALAIPGRGRDLNAFTSLLAASADRAFLLYPSWNYFASSGDEARQYSNTLEPNTLLAAVDGSPGQDPWYYYTQIQSEIRALKLRTNTPVTATTVTPSPARPSDTPVLTNLTFFADLYPDFAEGLRSRYQIDCVFLPEPADDAARAWEDNALCWPRQDGVRFSWSYDGPLPGKHCLNLAPPGEPPAHTWPDNYLCSDVPLGLTVHAARPERRYCVELAEPADPTWRTQFVCAETQRLTPAVELRSAASGKCLDVVGGSTAEAAPVQQWGCHGGLNQRWAVMAAGADTFWLVSAQSGRCLDVTAASPENGARLQQYTCHSGLGQQWRLQPAGDATYQVTSAASGKCMDVAGVSLTDGTPVQQWECLGPRQLNQVWTLRRSPTH